MRRLQRDRRPLVRPGSCAAVACLGALALVGLVARARPPEAAPTDGEAIAVPEPTASEARPGGATTLAVGRRAGLASAFANLSLRDRFDLGVGRAFFRDPWVAAPASTTARDGLGPLFNAHACVSCHPGGGRGALEPDGAPSTALLLRLWRHVPGQPAPLPDPLYGEQLQTRAIAPQASAAAAREGEVALRWTTVAGTFADGTRFELRRPAFAAADLAYGPLHEDTRSSARLAPSLRGVGLLEAIPARSIVARADPDDADRDGVSGRAAYVEDAASREPVLGRFGWKAAQPTARHQVASALRNDIGITSALFPAQPCSDAQQACRHAAGGGDPPEGHEIAPLLLDALVRFTVTLAVEARPRADARDVVRGHATFHRLGCAACHVPTFVTGESPVAEAAGQTIHPYTDLLLHDLGLGLADEVGEGAAGGAEWRTAPLWGLGTAVRDGERTSLLHDGRARTISEAILWHDGEAASARGGFARLTRDERAALLAFLASL
ncbi:MAG: di-heme oxidoredictase family protein [Thermodesulfobacteriota bacterium]